MFWIFVWKVMLLASGHTVCPSQVGDNFVASTWRTALKNELITQPPYTLDEVGDNDLAMLVLRCRIEVMAGNRAAHAWACAFEVEQRKRYRAGSAENRVPAVVHDTKSMGWMANFLIGSTVWKSISRLSRTSNSAVLESLAYLEPKNNAS